MQGYLSGEELVEHLGWGGDGGIGSAVGCAGAHGDLAALGDDVAAVVRVTGARSRRR
ncbi:hypothetical protein [Nocardia sp. Marseille-Q1738]